MIHARLMPLARTSRTVAAALIAGVTRDEAETVEARLRARPPRDQARIVGATLAALMGASVLAAQFGLPGMLAFLLAVIVLVR